MRPESVAFFACSAPLPTRPWRAFARSAALVSLLAMVGIACVGCGSLERAAAKDPLKCERDPACARTTEKNSDCTSQCVDDPACMDRCREMRQDTLGQTSR